MTEPVKFEGPIVTREAAIAVGATRYFTGKPCMHGHTAERSTVNGTCLVCGSVRTSEITKAPTQALRKLKDETPARPGEEYFPDFPIDQIKIGERHRKEMGELGALADSIREIGVLQPIGITPDCKLIWGERRLGASLLADRKTIPARQVKLASIARGEHDENELRKDFTTSERVAILEAIGRKPVGNPGFTNSADRPNSSAAAKRAGFDSERTARKAAAVIDHGVLALVAAMDKGEVSIDAAAVIAKAPPAEQTRIVALPASERKARVRKLRVGKTEQLLPNPLPKLTEGASTLLFKVPAIETPFAPKEDDEAVSIRVLLTNAKQTALTLFRRMSGDVFRDLVAECNKLLDAPVLHG